MTFIEIGIAHGAVTLCDRSHATLPERVDYTSQGPFAPRFKGGIRYTSAPMFANAVNPNAVPRHSSLRGKCPEGGLK